MVGKQWPYALLVGLVGAMLSCGENGATASKASNQELNRRREKERTSLCTAACQFRVRCGATVDTNCVETCLEDKTESLRGYAQGYLTSVAQCLDEAPCELDLNGALEQCHGESVEQLNASNAVLDFCETMAARFFDCFFVQEADLPTCAHDYAFLNDQAAAKAAACLGAECGDLGACITQARQRSP